MPALAPGRNDPCPCGSGRKYKHCCLTARTAEDSVRLRLRGAEGRVVNALLEFIAETWDEEFMVHAWEDFWNYEDVPDDLRSTPEFDPMFIPWVVSLFVPDPEVEDADPTWPTQPVALEWLATTDDDVSELDRTYIEVACKSPVSAFVIEAVDPGRGLDLKDVLTGKRFHVLEASASQRIAPADLLFTRVLTFAEASVMFGAAPFIIPPRWHPHIIDWRESVRPKQLMTRTELEDFDIEIRDLYFNIVADLFNPQPPQLCNTDGDPIALTTLTYTLTMPVDEVFDRLSPLATIGQESSVDDVTRDADGRIVTATLTWLKAGNRQHKKWESTSLGNLRLAAGSLVAEVNSERRATRLKREIAKRLGAGAVLADTTVVDMAELLEERERQRAAGELAEEPDAAELPLQSDELLAIQEELTRQHWAEWLDTRVPALGNKTPRQAARSPLGRERLEALLASFERDAAHQPASMAAPVQMIRETLGLLKPWS